MASNLSQTKNNDDLEPYLESFLSNNGLTELAPLLRVTHEGIATTAITPLPTIFEYYSAHDCLKENPAIIMDVYAKIEDNSPVAIKIIALTSLTSLLSTMRSGSFNMILKTALRYAR